MTAFHFFISRASEDREWAKWISNVLEAAGHTTTLQDFDFKPGQSFLHQMKLAEDRANHFIAVLSPDYLRKPYTLSEFYSGIAEQPLGEKRLLIPVRVQNCEIPRLVKDLIFVDFVNQSEATCKQLLLGAIRPERIAEQVSFPGTAPQLGPSIRDPFTRKLPNVDRTLMGRDARLEWLEQCWTNPQINFVQIIAPGGTGKTALMTRWYRRHLDNAAVFGWSFYSQGTSEKSQTSSDPFFAEALPWFGITVPVTESIFTKVDLLVAHLRHERVLLILDGIEPLQDPEGGLRDMPMRALLQELAARNAGMVVATTRVRLSDVPDDQVPEAPHSRSFDLENLDPADGARYLAHLGVRGPDDELRSASEAYDNHALALTLLGTYLVTFCDSDVRRRTDIHELQLDDTQPGRHSRKVMASYARMYERQPELNVLIALGYFNRPAEAEALRLVLPEMDDRKYKAALKRLRDQRLILTKDPAQPVDCHPLVREYFAADTKPEGHARLYEHYKTQAPHFPDNIEEMTPLFYAVYHGCKAGPHQSVLDEVYISRIRRRKAYLVKSLGLFSTDLSLLANFFQTQWAEPSPTITTYRSWLVYTAGLSLRAVGRLAEAVEPVRVAAETCVKSEEWANAAQYYGNLSELQLALGSVPQAIATARRSLDFAGRTDQWTYKSERRANLADTLHQYGELAEAASLFKEAETLRVESRAAIPMLYSQASYRYCDFLLSRGQTSEVVGRVSLTLPWAERQGSLLDIGLNHLLLGRSHPTGSLEGCAHLDHAVDYLRRSGRRDHLPLGLLARGTPQDLDEVFRIASRSGMRLYLTDYHLASARLALKNSNRNKAREHFTKAETLVNETGYHRRDREVAELRSALNFPAC